MTEEERNDLKLKIVASISDTERAISELEELTKPIAMLNVSATQELFKLITKLQSDNQELKDKLHDYSSLKSDVELLKEAMGIDMQSAK